MTEINNTLAERGSRYGDYKTHAEITQTLKFVMQNCDKWDALSADKRETLEMFAHKIGRILNGDPECVDNWRDLAAYATLSERLCK